MRCRAYKPHDLLTIRCERDTPHHGVQHYREMPAIRGIPGLVKSLPVRVYEWGRTSQPCKTCGARSIGPKCASCRRQIPLPL